ncbi:17780_t:CDS:2 [Cetraspora pellucida]|uniref:17780_t:CDS:1 n=1 Tax=Cetraspora pellucida TaxID=1433469 RepID=A0A9N9CX85_9GLOM|nr:17780_t:CDS:2 [Cetraspora pellucida]
MTVYSFCQSFLNTLLTHFVEKDACAKIYKQGVEQSEQDNKVVKVSYQDAKECLESFRYNRTIAVKTLDTIKKTLQGFYPYLEKAKEEPAPEFSTKPVDLIKELDLLLERDDYTTDLQFMTDVQDTVGSLKDGHLFFSSNCYVSRFVFTQQLYLYSTIKNNETQVIQVLEDLLDPSNDECEVTKIDEHPAMEVIIEFAYTLPEFRDLGVAFNNALTSYTINNGTNISLNQPQFTTRSNLPEKSSISYTLTCTKKNSTIIEKTISREWVAIDQIPRVFKDSKTYWNEFCIAKHNDTKVITENKNKELELKHGRLLYSEDFASFYTLGETGIVVISSFISESSNDTKVVMDMMKGLNHGFKLLAQARVKKLVLDLQNNNGGFIEVSQFVVHRLFLSANPFFPNDNLVTPLFSLSVQKASEKSEPSTDFSPKAYLNAYTYQQFDSATDFLGENYQIRDNNKVRTTNKYIDANNTQDFQEIIGSNIKPLPWQSKDMIILTNGLCGSACAALAQHLSDYENVKTVAVGGFYNRPMSYSSFIGGSVTDFVTLMGMLKELNVTDDNIAPREFLVSTTFSFTFREIYGWKDERELLEFSFKPAKERLYYNNKNVRDPSLLWVEVAKLID